jgi:hypothetical protein
MTLEALDGRPTSRGPLRLAEIRPGRFPEERDAVLTVGGQDVPPIRVKHFAGRPSAHVPPWVEASVPCEDERLAAEILAALAALLPPGGHLMVVYGADETARGLQRGFPPVATPLGHALFRAGCTWFKDWYFAEGGREGDTKLQGNKPSSAELQVEQVARMRDELEAWLAHRPANADEILRRARERARAALTEAAGA